MPTKYIHFTDEQKEQARQTDLCELLRSQGEKLKRSGSEYEWQDGSQKVTIRGNLWFHQYDQQGGDAIDFVRRFYNKDYPEAVEYSVTSADLHGIDLIQIKVCCGPSNVALRKIPLVFLIGYQVLDRDLFKMNIGDKLIQIFHSVLLDSAQQIAHVISQRKKLPDEPFPCMGRDDGQIRLFQNPVDRA